MKSKTHITLLPCAALEKRWEWQPLKKKGYRVPDADGVTVWHEIEAIRRLVRAAFADREADIFFTVADYCGLNGNISGYRVAYAADPALPAACRAELQAALDELPIPARVDLVDIEKLPRQYRHTFIAEKDGDTWQRRSKNSIFT